MHACLLIFLTKKRRLGQRGAAGRDSFCRVSRVAGVAVATVWERHSRRRGCPREWHAHLFQHHGVCAIAALCWDAQRTVGGAGRACFFACRCHGRLSLWFIQPHGAVSTFAYLARTQQGILGVFLHRRKRGHHCHGKLGLRKLWRISRSQSGAPACCSSTSGRSASVLLHIWGAAESFAGVARVCHFQGRDCGGRVWCLYELVGHLVSSFDSVVITVVIQLASS